jgi:hypothetical protein
MTTITFGRTPTRDPLTSVAAWACVASGVLMIVAGIPLAPLQAQSPPPTVIALSNMIIHLLQIAAVVGLVRSHAMGAGRLAVAGPALTLLGLAALIVAEAAWLAQSGESDAFYAIATGSMLVGLLLLGTAVLRARVWTGWHRLTPLACGVYILVVLLPSFALPGLAMHYAIGLWGVCWSLLGLALLRVPID